jgi:hypothetical protein
MTPLQRIELGVGVEPITEAELLKRNAIRLADHHREHCDGATCNVMLSMLVELLDRAGIETTPEERSHFA